jgi:hypothetical protein
MTIADPVSTEPASVPSVSDWRLHLWLLIGSLIVAALAATMSVHGTAEVRLPGAGFSLPELCYFRLSTGLDCPGCGLTRSFISAAHGQWAAAWHYNPAGFLLFPVVLFQIPYRVAQLLRLRSGQRPWNLGTVATGVFIALFIVLLVQWVGKYLPLW